MEYEGCLFIDRQCKDSRKKAIQAIKDRCDLFMNDPAPYIVNPLVMMPEGCYTNNSVLLKFKKGAFLPMKPIKIYAFKWKTDRYNLSNIALRSIFSRIITGM